MWKIKGTLSKYKIRFRHTLDTLSTSPKSQFENFSHELATVKVEPEASRI